MHLKLNLKVKINAHGKKKLEPNQDDASDHFLSAKRLHARPTFGSNDHFLSSQVKSYFPVYMKHFLNPPQGEAKRDNNPRERSFSQCVVCGQELFQ